jgi:hypothetical protein
MTQLWVNGCKKNDFMQLSREFSGKQNQIKAGIFNIRIFSDISKLRQPIPSAS